MNYPILSALGNEVRLKLLICLHKKEKNVSELINNCGLSQSAVSQHLDKLRNAGLVITRKDGKQIYYSLSRKKIGRISKAIMSFIQEVENELKN